MEITHAESGAFMEIFSISPLQSGLLDGLTFAVKDCIDVKGYKTGNGNPTWQATHPPAATHAICVEQMLQQGAVCIGKTVCDEICFGINGENYFYGTPLNPKAIERIPGGSSSGSASCVACNLADFALGTDTGGSTRVPASNCGLLGMRTSHDWVSVSGVCPLSTSFDTIGFLAREIDVFLKVGSALLAGPLLSEEIERVYWIEEAFAICESNLDSIFDKFKEAFGNKVESISLATLLQDATVGNLADWRDTFSILHWSEVWTNHGSWIEGYQPEFGPRVKITFDLAKNLDRSKILAAISKRKFYCTLIERALSPNTIICIPTTPSIAPIKGSLGLDRSTGSYFPNLFALTCIASLTKLPQISLPLTTFDGAPLGISILGKQNRDLFLLNAAQEILKKL